MSRITAVENNVFCFSCKKLVSQFYAHFQLKFQIMAKSKT